MKMAILLSGQPRFTGDFDLLLKNLKGYDQADWFININNNNHDRLRFKYRKVNILDSWVEFDLDWAKNKIIENLPVNNYIRKFAISDDKFKTWPTVKNLYQIKPNWTDVVFMMFYNIYRANQLRLEYQKETGEVYDAVVRARTDVGIEQEFDIRSLKILPNAVYMPNNEWWGNGDNISNDQMAIGDEHSMNIYCDLINHIKSHNDRGAPFHPETLLAYHLKSNGISTVGGNYTAGLRKFPIDITRWQRFEKLLTLGKTFVIITVGNLY